METVIQQNNHCSIEDAQTALSIYKKYLEFKSKHNEEQMKKLIQDIYTTGQRQNWVVPNVK
jgi:PAB-dependent poly(A)-specific ribonuclease subunit 2